VNIEAVNLKFLIEQLWQIPDEMLLGAPKWLDEDKWDVTAQSTFQCAPLRPRTRKWSADRI